ncbi:MAG: hypothetical protein MJ252_26690 [archaeon]|nr:hypothetical protein [archaeon]
MKSNQKESQSAKKTEPISTLSYLGIPNNETLEEKICTHLRNCLSLYERTNDVSGIPQEIKDDPAIFRKESQIPDLWLKTKVPFNKNLCFVDFTSMIEEIKAFPGGSKKVPTQYFPRTPFTLSPNCDLLRMNKKTEIIPGLNSSSMATKIWIVSANVGGKRKQYGPFNSRRIRDFISFHYNKMPDETQKKMGILIIDLENDVHYAPHLLEEYFQMDKEAPEILRLNDNLISKFDEDEKEKDSVKENEKEEESMKEEEKEENQNETQKEENSLNFKEEPQLNSEQKEAQLIEDVEGEKEMDLLNIPSNVKEFTSEIKEDQP